MRHPLKVRHWAGREFLCWLRGHDIVTCSRKKRDYDRLIELPDEAPEIWAATLARANPYYEDLAWWAAKCRRCRDRYSTWWEVRESWHIRVSRGLRSFARSTKIGWDCTMEHTEVPRWRRWVAAPIIGFFFGLEQGWSNYDGPYWVTLWASNIHFATNDWLEPHRRQT